MYIECINAKLAANRAAQRDLQAMRESLDRLRDQLSTRDGHLYRLDHIFHWAVAAATQNRLLYRECELLLDHYLRFEVKSVYNNPSTPRSSLMSMWPSAMPSRKGAPSGQSRPWPDT